MFDLQTYQTLKGAKKVAKFYTNYAKPSITAAAYYGIGPVFVAKYGIFITLSGKIGRMPSNE
ncbi:MAG: hypothetical protein COA54_00810 [Thiotrichaceae bacterium]|nr:MAG: hypothetical protein COA54_00810 [Thiotrichaceae bacterium]